MSQRPDYFCNYPAPKGQRRPCVMKQSELKKFLYTDEFPEQSDLNWLIASTDYMTVGEYQLSPGSHFAPADVHAGDEIYYVLRGEVTMFQPESGQVMQIPEGEGILMPKGCPHVGYNFGEKETRMLYAVAPHIWDEEGSPTEHNGEFRVYKYDVRKEAE